MILFRGVFVSGLREFLGAKAGLLKVTKAGQMEDDGADGGHRHPFPRRTGLEHLEGIARRGLTPEQYADLVSQGLADPIQILRAARLFFLCDDGRADLDLDRCHPHLLDRMGLFPEGLALPQG